MAPQVSNHKSRKRGSMQLARINIYPVKSCKGISLTQATLSPFGLTNDRRSMVVDSAGTFLSQRRMPKMAIIEPTLSEQTLQLKAPGSAPIEIAIERLRLSGREVRIWDDSCTAIDCGDAASDWLTQLLEIECRLVTMGNTFSRSVDPRYSRNLDQVGFADAFPLLLISTASLRDLNSRLETPVPMNRFRPNLVVNGRGPYDEDTWKRISVGDLTFNVSKPCARCTIPAVDQSTGTRGQEPLTTLATYRKGSDDKVFFGQNLINEQKSGLLTVGTEVTIVQRV